MKNKSKASFICREVFSVENIGKVVVSILLTVILIWTFTFPTNHIIWFGIILIILMWFYIACCIGGSVYDGLCDYEYEMKIKKDIEEKPKTEPISSNLIIMDQEKQKKKRFVIYINFYDNTKIELYLDKPIDPEDTYITAFYDFYKWFFFRESSEIYSFKHREGTYIFYKKDIKRVDFKEEIIEE